MKKALKNTFVFKKHLLGGLHNYTPQWRIQDFPLGGCRAIGGVPTSNVGAFQRKQKNWILLGGGGAPAAPPGSANAPAYCKQRTRYIGKVDINKESAFSQFIVASGKFTFVKEYRLCLFSILCAEFPGSPVRSQTNVLKVITMTFKTPISAYCAVC